MKSQGSKLSWLPKPRARARVTDWQVRNSNGGTTFVGAEEMKERVRAQLMRKESNIHDLYKDDGWCQGVARSSWFDNLTLVVISANALWLAIDADYNDALALNFAHPVFHVAENLFCCYFLFEWLVRLLAFKRKQDCCQNRAFALDTVLILSMILDTWVMVILVAMLGIGSDGTLDSPSIFRFARILRVIRIARMARLLRVMPELMILVKGMIAAARSVCLTMGLLAAVTYVFGIAFRLLTTGTTVGQARFESVMGSMYTLVLHGCLLDDVADLASALREESAFLILMFLIFVFFAALTVMNMLTGVLCEVVTGVAASEKEDLSMKYVRSKVLQIVEELDFDGDNSISKTEFSHILQNIESCRALLDVGVDVIGLVDFVDNIFVDDAGLPTEELTFVKFMDVLLQLRGTNNATVKDIVELRKLVGHTNASLATIQSDMQSVYGGMMKAGQPRDAGRTCPPPPPRPARGQVTPAPPPGLPRGLPPPPGAAARKIARFPEAPARGGSRGSQGSRGSRSRRPAPSDGVEADRRASCESSSSRWSNTDSSSDTPRSRDDPVGNVPSDGASGCNASWRPSPHGQPRGKQPNGSKGADTCDAAVRDDSKAGALSDVDGCHGTGDAKMLQQQVTDLHLLMTKWLDRFKGP